MKAFNFSVGPLEEISAFRRRRSRFHLCQQSASHKVHIGVILGVPLRVPAGTEPSTAAATAAPKSTSVFVVTAEAKDLPQDVRERVLEVAVRHDVDHRVEGGVEVSDPEEDGDDDVGARAVGLAADRHREVPREEGQPAEEEGPHNDAQGHEGLVLFAPRSVNAMSLAEP